MRWLANENFPLASIRRLRTNGEDVAAIAEDMSGAPDRDVLARAVNEARIILTFDRDYGELIFRIKRPAPPGIAYFRFNPQTPEEPAERLLQLLGTAGFVFDGKFTVIERIQVRQRRLSK